MKVIGIDTSESIGSVAAREGESRKTERFFSKGLHHGVELIPKLEEVCREMNWNMRDADLIAVSIGPGSYTGIRIGVATVKGLSYACGVPVIGIASLDALAENAPEGISHICTVLDAKREKVYASLYRSSERGMERLWPLAVRSPEEVAERCPAGTLVLGSGLVLYKDRFASLRKDLLFGEEESWQVRAIQVTYLGERDFLAGRRDDPLTLTPLYLRPSEAEIRWQEKKEMK